MTAFTPSAADFAEAERFVAEEYDADGEVCRTWLANHRSTLVRYAADAAMQKRQDAEWREAVKGNSRTRKAA